ncbi:VENN motif pre-toxin domain-containing protein, partial [Muribacter muris]
QLTGRSPSLGALAGIVAESSAEILSRVVFGKSPNDLTEGEKQQVVALSQVASALATTVAGGNGETVAMSMASAKNAVEHNFFDVDPHQDRIDSIKLFSKLYFNGNNEQAEAYYDAMQQGKSKGFKDNVVETAEAILNLDETVKSLAYAVTHPNEVIEKVYVSMDEWNQHYENAVKNDPALAGEMQGYILGNFGSTPVGGMVVGAAGAKLLQKSATLVKKAGTNVADFATHQVHRVVNHTTLNKVINEIDSVAVSTDKGFINATKVCAASCEVKATSKVEQNLIDDIIKNGDIKGNKTEALIHDLAKRSGYEPLKGGKYGSNNGFDHVLLGKDGSVIIIDSKQLKHNGAIQVSSKGAKNTNQLSKEWINVIAEKLPDNDSAKIAIQNAIDNKKPIKTIIAGVDKTNNKVLLLPVKIPDKK